MDQTSSSTPEGVASNSSSTPKKQSAGKSWLLRLFSFGAVAGLAWFFNVHLAVLLASCTLDAFSQGNEKPYLERPDNVRFAHGYQPQALAAWLWVPHPNYQATVAKLTGNSIAKNPDADAAGIAQKLASLATNSDHAVLRACCIDVITNLPKPSENDRDATLSQIANNSKAETSELLKLAQWIRGETKFHDKLKNVLVAMTKSSSLENNQFAYRALAKWYPDYDGFGDLLTKLAKVSIDDSMRSVSAGVLDKHPDLLVKLLDGDESARHLAFCALYAMPKDPPAAKTPAMAEKIEKVCNELLVKYEATDKDVSAPLNEAALYASYHPKGGNWLLNACKSASTAKRLFLLERAASWAKELQLDAQKISQSADIPVELFKDQSVRDRTAQTMLALIDNDLLVAEKGMRNKQSLPEVRKLLSSSQSRNIDQFGILLLTKVHDLAEEDVAYLTTAVKRELDVISQEYRKLAQEYAAMGNGPLVAAAPAPGGGGGGGGGGAPATPRVKRVRPAAPVRPIAFKAYELLFAKFAKHPKVEELLKSYKELPVEPTRPTPNQRNSNRA